MDTYLEILDSKSVTVSSVNSISSTPFLEFLEHCIISIRDAHKLGLTKERAVLYLQNNIAFIYQML